MGRILVFALALMAGALSIGAVDGLYFHLWKFRLYARPASKSEHLTHTVRACLLAPMVWLAFVAPNLPALLGVVVVDFAVVLADVSLENDSRRDLGGIPTPEYLVHVVAGTLHTAAMALVLAFWWTAATAPIPTLVREGALALIAMTVPVALLHLALLVWKPGAPAVGVPPAG